MSRNHPAISMLSNDTNELIVKMQQGALITEVKGESATTTGADPDGLSR